MRARDLDYLQVLVLHRFRGERNPAGLFSDDGLPVVDRTALRIWLRARTGEDAEVKGDANSEEGGDGFERCDFHFEPYKSRRVPRRAYGE